MTRTFTAMLLVFLTGAGLAAEPIFIDQLMEMNVETLRQQFPKLRNDGCYQIGPDSYLLIDIDRKDRKPSRVALASAPPCRRPEEGYALDLRERSGIVLGDSTLAILEKLGRPDASAAPDPALRKLGETEYFYICRVSEGCARHTSVFMRDGLVSAIVNWYSE